MKSAEFKEQLIAALKIEGVDPAAQDDLLAKLEDAAYARLGNALPELLTEEQLEHIEGMRNSKKSDEEIMDWIQSQLPHFKEMMQAILMDMAAEIEKIRKMAEKETR